MSDRDFVILKYHEFLADANFGIVCKASIVYPKEAPLYDLTKSCYGTVRGDIECGFIIRANKLPDKCDVTFVCFIDMKGNSSMFPTKLIRKLMLKEQTEVLDNIVSTAEKTLSVEERERRNSISLDDYTKEEIDELVSV
jgi:hypothetical protein